MSFWDVVWLIVVSFAFVAYLMVMFSIIADLIRDRDLNGWLKAVWVVCLIFLPFLTALVYLIARGRGMSERQVAAVSQVASDQEAYIKSVAGDGASPADQIAKAKGLLDSGAINQAEFDQLKAKALA